LKLKRDGVGIFIIVFLLGLVWLGTLKPSAGSELFAGRDYTTLPIKYPVGAAVDQRLKRGMVVDLNLLCPNSDGTPQVLRVERSTVMQIDIPSRETYGRLWVAFEGDQMPPEPVDQLINCDLLRTYRSKKLY